MSEKVITAAEVTSACLVPIGAAVQWGAGIGLIVAGVVGLVVTELVSFGGRS